MEIHPIAIGAVIAAGITGLISLLGLIISKEQKTSEFRQQWIDSLREEISELLGHTEALIQHVRAIIKTIQREGDGRRVTEDELFEKVKPEIVETETYYHKILLRLNPIKHKKLIDKLEVMRLAFNSGSIPSPEELHEMEMALIKVSQEILKTEWDRVKTGEPTFRAAKYGAVLLLMISVVAGGYLVFAKASGETGSNKAAKLGHTSATHTNYAWIA